LACCVPYLPSKILKIIEAYILIDFFFNSKVLILKSTPMVGRKFSLKILSEKRRIKHDFPTALLPTKRILNR